MRRRVDAGRRRCPPVVLALIATTMWVSAAPPGRAQDASALPADRDAASRQLQTDEDQRAAAPGAEARLRAGLAHSDVAVRRQAARAVGRLEDARWLAALTPLLDDASIDVQAEAAWAIAQAAGAAAAPAAADVLRARLAEQPDLILRAALVLNLARLSHPTPDALDAAAQVVDAQLVPDLASPWRTLPLVPLAVARGAESLARRCAQLPAPCQPTRTLLARLLREHQPGALALAPTVAARIRRLAALGLHALGAIDQATRSLLMTDPDEEVRRVAALALAADPDATSAAASALGREDPSPLVRGTLLARGGTRWPDLARAALADADIGVRLAALDALGAAGLCGCDDALAQAHDASTQWHVFAHALVASARSNAEAAVSALERGAASAVWQVRMYAARAAGAMRDIERLRWLARDPHANVREAALTVLDGLDHRASDDLRREALASSDYQLVRTATRGLAGTTEPAAARTALLEALQRLTDDQRDTSRDPRLELLDRLAEVADAGTLERLAAWSGDADPVVAARAAALVAAQASSAPRPAPLPAFPAASATSVAAPAPAALADGLDGREVVLTLHGLGEVTIRLAADEAPLNASRFVRQVEAGAWDGLTFHRVEAGFVVQGGSPGANEYVGADRYTRDERSARMHARGTVGISTRGRDTGDGQIFVNLVDNPRLDHAYTIIGHVVSGMPHVDAMLEGAAIVQARVMDLR